MSHQAEKFPPITSEWLQDLFRDKKRRILRGQRTPTDKDLSDLATNLVGLQITAEFGHLWAADNQARRETLGAIRLLLPRISVTRQRMEEIVEYVKQYDLKIIYKTDRDMFRRLESDLTRLRNSSRMALSPPFESWREFAPTIAKHFVSAMAGANPDLQFGVSNEGPVARFVVAIVPMITGETVNEARVAQYLKRLRRASQDISTSRV